MVFLDGDDLLLPWALTVYNEVAEREQPHIILSTMRWFEGQIPNVSGDRAPDNIEVVAYDSLLEKDRPYRASASALVYARLRMSATTSASTSAPAAACDAKREDARGKHHRRRDNPKPRLATLGEESPGVDAGEDDPEDQVRDNVYEVEE